MIAESRHPHPHIDPRYPRQGGRELTNPPVFAWKPDGVAPPYFLEVARDASFTDVALRAEGLVDPVYLPAKALEPDGYHWRWGSREDVASIFAFEILPDAIELEVPSASAWLEAIPKGHPRLYVAEGEVDAFRKRCKQDAPEGLDDLLKSANQLLGESHRMSEPEFLPDRSLAFEAFWKIWYPTMGGSRRFVKGAETLGLAYRATGNAAFGRAACERLVSGWDPEGSSYLGHNDEAHMSVIWHAPHASDWVWDLFLQMNVLP